MQPESLKLLSPLRVVLALVVVALLALLGRYEYWVEVEHRFQTITEGRLYKSGEMPSEELVDRVGSLGIRTVIDLRDEVSEVIDAERDALEKAGVKYVNLPSKQVPEETTVDTYLTLMKRPENFPVLIHCEHGVGRSVLFAALYRIEFEGWGSERARCATTYFPWRGSFKPDSPKGEYLRNYKPRSR
ncbi:MAG: dual specificity protein phosphatase family protein [Planctomycetota bacterium]